jgi:hypothetical protein
MSFLGYVWAGRPGGGVEPPIHGTQVELYEEADGVVKVSELQVQPPYRPLSEIVVEQSR